MNETTINGRVAGYDLDPPSKDYAIQALARFMGEAEATALWDSACVTHDVLSNTDSLEDLENVFRDISHKPGSVGVIGKSLLVRINSYKLLKMKSEWNLEKKQK